MSMIRFEYDCDSSASHFHDELEILYVLAGRVGVMVDGGNFLLGLEDFVVFNPFEYHELYREAGGHTLSAYIPFSILQQCRMNRIVCCSARQKDQTVSLNHVRRNLALVYQNYLAGESAKELSILSGVYGLLSVLKEHFEVLAPEEEADARGSGGKLRQVLLYIHDHYTENMSLQDIAEKHYLSAGHLSRQFERQMGMHFSDYLRNLRLRRAAQLLRSTDRSVIEIAEECGFANVNTLTSNFRLLYGETPSVYRKQRFEKKEESGEDPSRNDVRLLKYAGEKERLDPAGSEQPPTSVIRADVSGAKIPLQMRHNVAISSGYAKDYLVDMRTQALEKSVREIGFRYVFVQGILDDSISIYHERLDGTAWFNYTYLDTIIDHIYSMGALPWLELSHTPGKLVDQTRMIFNDSYIQLPSDLDKWRRLIDHVLEHLILRYGKDQVSQWRLSLFPALYLSYHLFLIEDYLEYYRCTYQTIRGRLPEVKIISGAFDSGYLMIDGPGILQQYLAFCQEHACIPDEIGLQVFAVDYTELPRKEIESRILVEITKKDQEPAPPSRDENFVRHNVEFVREILNANGVQEIPICLIYWSPTMWSHDLGNDTCYMSAFVAKSCLEVSELVSSLNNNLFIDLRTDFSEAVEPFSGYSGSINYMGIPKAAYHALCMLSQLESLLVDQGDGYVVTCSEDHKRVRILLYHYCHFNLNVHINQVLPLEERLTIDRYSEFLDPGSRRLQLTVAGMDAGTYDEERYVISRACGSSYDIWRRMGSPCPLNVRQKDYLVRASDPGYHYEKRKLRAGEELQLHAVLNAHEVQMISLTLQDGITVS